jgi:hypothetical protein
MKPTPPRVVVLVNNEEVRSYEWHKYGVMPSDIEWAKRGGSRFYTTQGNRVEIKPKEQK